MSIKWNKSGSVGKAHIKNDPHVFKITKPRGRISYDLYWNEIVLDQNADKDYLQFIANEHVSYLLNNL